MNQSLKFFVVFLFSAFAIFNWTSLFNIIAVGDVAGDMLTANKIKDEGYLLLGHWSVWKFNHPGPFWFYYNYLIENIFSWLPLSRIQKWYLGSLILNSFLIAYSARILSFYYLNRFNIIYAFIFIFFLTQFSESILELWMPFRIIAPYLAFFVCLLPLSKGNFNYLFPCILFSCLLIHGYAIMPFFTLPFIILAFFMGYRFNQHLKKYKFVFILSAFTALLFSLPILIDYFINQPYSNLNRLFLANQKMQIAEKPALSEIIFEVLYRFINKIPSHIKTPDYTLFYLIPFLIFYILLSSKEHRGQLSKKHFEINNFLNNAKPVLFFSIVTYLFTIFYFAFRTSKPFIFYAVHFLTIVPPILFLTLLTPFFLFAWENKQKTIYFKPLHYLFILIISLVLFFSKQEPDEGIAYFERKTEQFVSFLEKQNPPIYLGIDLQSGIDFAAQTVHLILGILAYLNDQNISICITDTSTESAINLTQKHRCVENQKPQWLIVPAKKCHYYKQCVLTDGYFGLVKQ